MGEVDLSDNQQLTARFDATLAVPSTVGIRGLAMDVRADGQLYPPKEGVGKFAGFLRLESAPGNLADAFSPSISPPDSEKGAFLLIPDEGKVSLELHELRALAAEPNSQAYLDSASRLDQALRGVLANHGWKVRVGFGQNAQLRNLVVFSDNNHNSIGHVLLCNGVSDIDLPGRPEDIPANVLQYESLQLQHGARRFEEKFGAANWVKKLGVDNNFFVYFDDTEPQPGKPSVRGEWAILKSAEGVTSFLAQWMGAAIDVKNGTIWVRNERDVTMVRSGRRGGTGTWLVRNIVDILNEQRQHEGRAAIKRLDIKVDPEKARARIGEIKGKYGVALPCVRGEGPIKKDTSAIAALKKRVKGDKTEGKDRERLISEMVASVGLSRPGVNQFYGDAPYKRFQTGELAAQLRAQHEYSPLEDRLLLKDMSPGLRIKLETGANTTYNLQVLKVDGLSVYIAGYIDHGKSQDDKVWCIGRMVLTDKGITPDDKSILFFDEFVQAKDMGEIWDAKYVHSEELELSLKRMGGLDEERDDSETRAGILERIVPQEALRKHMSYPISRIMFSLP